MTPHRYSINNCF